MIVSDMNCSWDEKPVTGACFIELEKGFDTVWIEGLIEQLLRYKADMISNKKFRLNIGDEFRSR